MTRTLIALVAAALLALAAAGCGSDDDTPRTTSPTGTSGSERSEVSAADLAGKKFVSTDIAGPRTLVDGSQVALQFDDDSLAANAGCNNMLGGYEIVDARLRWATDPISTAIGCRPDLMRQDDWLAGFFRGVGAEIGVDDDGQLVLARDGVELWLREGTASSGPARQAPIVGTRWTLVTIADGGADGTASSVPAGVTTPTLRFTDDDRAEVFAGCNGGGGRGVVGDDGFAEIGPLALTRKACDEAAMATERTVTSILDGRVALGFDGGGNLVVSKAGRQLIFRAG
ncbi:META domain-containing protein [Conexibacter sp. JD483]|uniref:META domain-containing protein n=1 Tax=unclassified Conexibacter TaxID=2627773 RepID=UPI00271F6184|nr:MULTISPECIES: META domain-containing protein [unclassified Conexibacter]MDO8185680.1 META domain-containing protein [Conexibacter sp. CPCC 205706]MDO8198853.1 META domain-containing protein [Conexibacter sp. CPCC 205762]MDR9372086.1 META domain-containing protein [Conexibacter sp. JD483]